MNSQRSPSFLPLQCLALSTVLMLAAACGSPEEVEPPSRRRAPTLTAIDQRWTGSPEWIDTYQPQRSDPGYNLILYNRRVPLLMDMDGSIVHTWPEVRASGRARLLPTGHLAVIGEDGSLAEYDWDGGEVWRYTLEESDTFLHHDFIVLENGNYLLLAHDPEVASDHLLEVDREKRIVWRWNSHEHLADDFVRAGQRNNKTHINSVNEIPQNRWHQRGSEEFRPGNILISARNLNAIYVVERPGGRVVWSYFDGLDYQHEALMIPPGRPGAGNIVFFNNGYHNLYAFRQSAVVEINPVAKTIVWEFRRPGFYSSTGGTQQSLPNGNLLVTSSQGGRVFELTRDGRIVWQWAPPYLPMRASRYPSAYSSRLRELGEPASDPIQARDPDQFIDANLYAFALPHETRRVKDGNRTRKVLRQQNRCQILQLPTAGKAELGFGRWRPDSRTPFIGSEARFVATIREIDQDSSVVLLDRTLGGDSLDGTDSQEIRLITETVDLGSFATRTVELCLSLSGTSGGPPPEDFVWEEPTIRAAARWTRSEDEDELDPEALEQQEKHLKAIGYLN